MSIEQTVKPRRSVLYMPGSNARALEKAKSLAADAVILDLEDAVAPDAKEAARDQVIAAVKAGGFGGREVIIRANALGTSWGSADLAAIAQSGADGVLLPKVESASDIHRAEQTLKNAGAPDSLAIWSMIETPRAILHLEAIADASERQKVWVMGTNDLVKDMQAQFVPGRSPLLPILTFAVLAGRAAGLTLLDGVYNDIKDADGFAAECRQGLNMGFDGKTLIHPSQLAPANETFAPTADEVTFAKQVIAAFEAPEATGKGVLKVEGKMVELLHRDQALRTVKIADAIAQQEGAG
ncbi:MAG: CoA ester lyase [Alphaproteobacteria bacterium]